MSDSVTSAPVWDRHAPSSGCVPGMAGAAEALTLNSRHAETAILKNRKSFNTFLMQGNLTLRQPRGPRVSNILYHGHRGM